MIPYGRHQVDWFDALSVAWQVRYRSLTQGNRISMFEKQVSEYVGAKYAIAVSSATAGLHLAMLALDLGHNDEVITTPISFVATSNSILYAGAVPVFLDISKNSLTLDFSKIEQAISRKTKAILTVHFAGLPDAPEDLVMARERWRLSIVEDAAHSLGAKYPCGSMVGSCKYSDMTVFSFHPVKSITTGEGGVITTNNPELYKRLLRLRSHGINKLEDNFQLSLNALSNNEVNAWYYEMQELGFNYRLTEIQAQLGLRQLSKLETFICKRRAAAENYRALLSNVPNIKPAQNVNTVNSAHHIFPILIDFDKIAHNRNVVMSKLRENGIGSQVHYIPIPFHPYYQKLGYRIDGLEEALEYYLKALSIPLFPAIKKKNQEKIVDILASIVA